MEQHLAEVSAIPGNLLEQEVAKLYTEHARELLQYASLILRQQDGASDAVHEAFLRYFAERKCGGVIDSPRAWLYRVLYNHLMDRLSRASYTREVASERTVEPIDAAQNPEERLSRSQDGRKIAAELTGRELDCLRLRADGLSYDEMAGVLGVRPGTVGALLNRVHNKLRLQSGDSPSLRMAIAKALWSLLHDGGSYSS